VQTKTNETKAWFRGLLHHLTRKSAGFILHLLGVGLISNNYNFVINVVVLLCCPVIIVL